MQRYQTEDERRKAMRAKINKTIKRGRRRKRIIRRLRKAVPGICIGVLIAGMGAWCIAAPLPDPDDYEPYRFQADNGQWYTQEEYEQMSRERDAYHQREREEAEKEAQMIRDYQEQYQKDQEAEWKLYQEQTRTGLIHSMDFDANDAYLLEKIAMAEGPGTNYDSAGYTGKGVFTIVAEKGGWGKLKSGAGWISLNSKYGHKVSSGSATPAAAPSTMKWAVTVTQLRIRKGPGTNYAWTGRYTGKGVFTIVEEKNGWGRLKSGAGWISLSTDYGHKA